MKIHINTITLKQRRYPDISFIEMNNECHWTAGYELFYTNRRLGDLFIVEEPTVTMKCRWAIQPMFHYFIVCLHVMLTVSHLHLHSYLFLLQSASLLYCVSTCNVDSLSRSFASISFLTKSCFNTLFGVYV